MTLPPVARHVLACSGAARLSYVGHSQGSTLGFTAFRGALAAKVALATRALKSLWRMHPCMFHRENH
jgi:hypothetical protein